MATEVLDATEVGRSLKEGTIMSNIISFSSLKKSFGDKQQNFHLRYNTPRFGKATYYAKNFPKPN